MSEWLNMYKHAGNFMVKKWFLKVLVSLKIYLFLILILTCSYYSNRQYVSSEYSLVHMLEKLVRDFPNDLFFQNHMIKELEGRVQQLTGEAENSNLQRQKLVQEKMELERCYQITCGELQELKTR